MRGNFFLSYEATGGVEDFKLGSQTKMEIKPFLDIYELQSFRSNGNYNYPLNGLFSNNEIGNDKSYPDLLFRTDRDPVISGLRGNCPFTNRGCDFGLAGFVEEEGDGEGLKPLPATCHSSLKSSHSPDSRTDINFALIGAIRTSSVNIFNGETFLASSCKGEKVISLPKSGCDLSKNEEKDTSEQEKYSFGSNSKVEWDSRNFCNFSNGLPTSGNKRKQRRYRYY